MCVCARVYVYCMDMNILYMCIHITYVYYACNYCIRFRESISLIISWIMSGKEHPNPRNGRTHLWLSPSTL